jgi:GNAT superfamily N-acetyltransferase
MTKIETRRLRDGATLEIFGASQPLSGDVVPDWFPRAFQLEIPRCWQLYYDEVFFDRTPGVRNFLYVGRIDGVPCCRMWFGYKLETGAGNFGNVFTLPKFRRRGIMREILAVCTRDFFASGALFCSCNAAAAAAPAYEQAGFRRIFPPDKPPMALMRDCGTTFAAVAEEAYRDPSGAAIRDGNLADRFDCDKLLRYVPEVYGKLAPTGKAASYLSLWEEYVRFDRAKVKVLVARSGFCAGYLYSLDGEPGGLLHPGFERYRKALERETV